MKPQRNDLAREMNNLHDEIAAFREMIRALGNPEAARLLEELETAFFSKLRAVRLLLDVPFNPLDAPDTPRTDRLMSGELLTETWRTDIHCASGFHAFQAIECENCGAVYCLDCAEGENIRKADFMPPYMICPICHADYFAERGSR